MLLLFAGIKILEGCRVKAENVGAEYLGFRGIDFDFTLPSFYQVIIPVIAVSAEKKDRFYHCLLML
ncbi:MAG: hypothetical protein ACI8XG_000914 [Congregibacter sp.]